MENTPTMTWILDEKNCFRYMNSSYMKAFGLSEAAIGRSIYEFYPAECATLNVQAINWSGPPIVRELTEKGFIADGSAVILQVYKFPLGVENGFVWWEGQPWTLPR